jgi:uncharacterized membrane protein
MKKDLAAGLIILLPIVLTLVIVIWLFDFMTQPFIGIVEKAVSAFETSQGVDLSHHETLVAVTSRIIILIALFILIYLLGLIARKFFFHHLIEFSKKIFAKIPLIKTIYNLAYEVTHAVFKEGEKTFKQTVLIPFPHKDTHALGLVTGEIPPALRKVVKEAELAVFVPTSPHPISGYVLLAPRDQLIGVDITTEEVFRFLISCGVTPLDGKKSEIPPAPTL